MKVWLYAEGVEYEGESVEYVFSSKELANMHAQNSALPSSMYWDIYEHDVLDELP
jgi:hypothetical protein